MARKGKKELKQFPLTNKTNCIIYLQRIIATSELCLGRLKKYNEDTEKLLGEYNKEDIIPYKIYEIEKDKTANVICYLLNILGDSQSTSISYFKFRKQIERLAKKGVDGIIYTIFSDDITDLLADFNRMRNWQNHIPESLLMSEIELIKDGKFSSHLKNPIELNIGQYVTYEYMEDLYNENVGFYKAARKLVQMCKKDYSLLIGESVRISKVYIEKPVGIEHLEVSKMSANIQGIKGKI